MRLTSGSIPDATVAGLTGSLEDIDSLGCAAHVGALRNDAAASLEESLGLFGGNFVLGGTGESDVDGGDESPGALAYNKGSQ